MNTKRFTSTIVMLLIACACFALGKDSANAITMESYEQSWSDPEGTLAIKNNTNEVVHDVTFQITYLNMAGKPLDYETFTKEIDIDPGMTKQIDIPAYEYDRSYSYYKSQDSQISPHKFKIKFKLKGYNQESQSDSATTLPSSKSSSLSVILAIAAGLFALGFWIGLYVLVAYMARVRNRSQVMWLLVALFTTPALAIIILLCIGKSHDDSVEID